MRRGARVQEEARGAGVQGDLGGRGARGRGERVHCAAAGGDPEGGEGGGLVFREMQSIKSCSLIKRGRGGRGFGFLRKWVIWQTFSFLPLISNFYNGKLNYYYYFAIKGKNKKEFRHFGVFKSNRSAGLADR